MTRILLVQDDANGQAQVTGAGFAILLGLDLDELRRRFDHTQGLSALPKDLRQLGNRRAREAQAATGAHESGPVMMYWAKERFGDAIDFEFDDKARALYLTADGPLKGFEEMSAPS